MELAKIKEKPLKIVTVCHGGLVRSAGLKFLLRYKYGHDVVPCGTDSNSVELREMLFTWADYIVILEKSMEEYIPEKYKTNNSGASKLFVYDVGPDRFGYAFHPELQKMLDGMIQQHGLFNK